MPDWRTLTGFENLLLAFGKARQRKRARPDVQRFEFDLERELLDLQDELLCKRYEPGEFREFILQGCVPPTATTTIDPKPTTTLDSVSPVCLRLPELLHRLYLWLLQRVTGRFLRSVICLFLLIPAANPLYAADCSGTAQAGPEMVLLPGGTFEMGSPVDEPARNENEGPQREVIVPDFALAVCEVTVAEFRRFVEATGYQTTAERDESAGCYHNSAVGQTDWEQRKEFNWRNALFGLQADDHPVVCVSFDDANAYIEWYSELTGESYRLPTEAEWEYASRAGTVGPTYYGELSQCDYANGADETAAAEYPSFTTADCFDGFVHTSPVSSFASNNWGLYDMLGNAWEWTQDCWHETYDDAPQDGSAWLDSGGGNCDRRVLRGGSWSSIPTRLRSADRLNYNRSVAFNIVGFRLARTPVPVPSAR